MDRYLIVYSDRALQDLREIFEYIAGQLREPVIAAAQINRIRAQIRSLGQFPARNKKGRLGTLVQYRNATNAGR